MARSAPGRRLYQRPGPAALAPAHSRRGAAAPTHAWSPVGPHGPEHEKRSQPPRPAPDGRRRRRCAAARRIRSIRVRRSRRISAGQHEELRPSRLARPRPVRRRRRRTASSTAPGPGAWPSMSPSRWSSSRYMLTDSDQVLPHQHHSSQPSRWSSSTSATVAAYRHGLQAGFYATMQQHRSMLPMLHKVTSDGWLSGRRRPPTLKRPFVI